MFTATTILKLSLTLLTASSTMVASLPPRNNLKPALHRCVCYEGETTNLCYTEKNGGIPQEVSEDDIKYVASYLRSYGRQVLAGRLLTMGPAELGTCDEWTLYQRGLFLMADTWLRTIEEDTGLLFGLVDPST